ncbi:hypothetical protein RH858_08350 [Halalkaliarchaeum sp. AArc-GB]|uniref:hypothetical protein n=1 Tax=Halalkaliarchaeum sp. AArc-GB TaxID=3074078 RepID=UPI0028551673|nr:hypothetical protein [Halalkaliarchaeum sp. AArc-GB]MDR5673159.1 hypothetical protein [Halalkaliarchaeum sp. AArc-GB]
MKRRGLLGSLVPLSVAGCLRLTDEEEPEQTTPGSGPNTESAQGEETPESRNDSGDEADTEGTDSANEEIEYPTGLDEEGVSPILADSHTFALRRTTATMEWTLGGVTGPHYAEERWAVRLGDGEAVAETMNDGPMTIHFAPNSGYWREEIGGGVTYGRTRQSAWYDISRIVRSHRLSRLIRAGDWNPPGYDEGTGMFSIEAEGVEDPSKLAEDRGADAIESFSATGEVTPDGIIRELEVEFEYRWGQDLYLEQIVLTVDDIEDVTVTTPDWVDTAREQAPEMTAEFVRDRQFIELTMQDGNPILAGTSLVVHDEENQGFGDFSEDVTPGDTLYLFVDDNGRGRISRETIPENASPVPFEGEFAIWARRNVMEYFFLKIG